MSNEQITTSAALYFGPDQGRSVTLCWFERARELLTEHNLSPILFSADGGGFLIDECYVLAQPGGDIVDDEGYVLAARGGDLVDALRNGAIESLGLDSPRSVSGGRSDWRATVSVSSTFGMFYLGLDDDLAPAPATLLRRAYDIAKDLIRVRYGIAYTSPLPQDPECYAIGRSTKFTLSMFREELRTRREGTYREKKNPDELWGDELGGERRHLNGLFRGAYPANILSESHVRAAVLRTSGIGRLSELDASLWLWELSESEIPKAQALLEARKLLVSQASQP